MGIWLLSADSSGTVSVLLGNGDGTFGFATSFPGVGSFIVVADFNHDGKLDVAGIASLIPGQRWDLRISIDHPGGGGTAVIGDFNNDGNLDLVGSISSNQVDVMLVLKPEPSTRQATSAVGEIRPSAAVELTNGTAKRVCGIQHWLVRCFGATGQWRRNFPAVDIFCNVRRL